MSRAIATMQESIHFGELANFVVPQAYTRADLAALYGDLGAVKLGLETARLALAAAEAHFSIVSRHCLGVIAKLHLLEGNVTDAEVAVRAAENAPDQDTWPGHFVPAPLADAELALEQGDYERALKATGALLIQLREFGMRAYNSYVMYVQAQALLGLRRAEEARQRFLESLSEAEAIGSRRVQWRVLLALSQIEADPGEAERLRRQAQQVVTYIADHIDQDDLRRSFLNQPDLRLLFGRSDASDV
jgi:ATP/maltotriose-dependent transcriptional regulator MalT